MWLFGKRGQRGSRAERGARRRAQRSSGQRNRVCRAGGFVERLEDRRLLAITANFVGGVLTFTGDAGDNELTILAADATSTNVSFSSATDTITLLGATTNPQAGITAIVVNLDGGAGDSLTIAGSAGADTIALNGLVATYGAVPYTLAAVENLTIEGQAGADTISATGVTVTGDLAIRGGAGAGDSISVSNLLTGNLVAGDAEATDDVELNLAVTATTGSQQYTSNVTLVGATTLSAVTAGQSIEFNGTVNGANTLALNADSIVFDGAVGGATPLVSVEVNGELALNGGSVSTTGDQTYNGPVTLNAAANATTLTSTAGSVRFNDTLNSFQLNEENLSIDAAVETVFGGTVGLLANGRLASLTTNSNTGNGAGITRINGGSVVTHLGDQVYQENVTLNAAGNVTALASVGGTLRFDGTVNSLQLNEEQLAVEAGAATVFNGEVGTALGGALASLTTNSAGAVDGVTRINGGAVTTFGGQNYQEDVTINAAGNVTTLTSLTESVAFQDNVDSFQLNEEDLTVNADDNVAFNGTVGGAAAGALASLDVNAGVNVSLAAMQVINTADLLATTGQISDLNGAANNLTAAALIANAATGISLDTTIGDLTANNTTSNGIEISDADDLNVLTVSAPAQTVTLAAGGAITDGNGALLNITAMSLLVSAVNGISLDTTIDNLLANNSTMGGIDLNETDNLNVTTVLASGQTVALTVGGTILDGNAAASNVTANSLVANATTGISLDTAIVDLTANNTVSGGIDISEADNLSVITVAAPGQIVTLAAGGEITDGNGPLVNVTTASLLLNAVNGINLDTTIDNLVANNSTLGGIDINETDNLNVLAILASGQTVTLNVGGVILDGNAAATNVTAGSLVANAVNGITLDTTIANLTASNTTSGSIDINETDNLIVFTVSAPGQTVTLAAGGAITDGNGPAVNVTATQLVVNAVNGISLDTTIVNLAASNTTSGGIDISETDDLNVVFVAAAGQIVSLAAGGDLNMNTVTAGTVNLSAGDMILDANGGAVNVTATSLVASAVNGISLDTTIANLTASNTIAGGIDINESDDVSVLTISAPGQIVTLVAGGAITDGNAGTTNVSAASLNVLAANGISLDTAIGDLTANNTATGGVDISDVDNLNVVTVSAPGQAVTLAAGGAITDGNGATSNISATSLIANAFTGISLDTTIVNLTATNLTSGGIDINELDNLNVLLVSAPNQLATLLAGGNLNVTSISAGNATLIAAAAITHANGAALNVAAGALNALANDGIALNTSITDLTATNNTTGDIVIREANGVSVLSAINNAGNIQVRSANGLVTITTVDSAGFFVGSTSDAAAAGDNLVVNGSIEANGIISLIAGDNVTLGPVSLVRSMNSFVYMKTDAATVDTTGGTLILLGTLQGNNALQYPVVAQGDIQDDLFSIQKLPLSPIAILAEGGALDNTFILLTNAAETVRVFATIVDVVGQPLITYVGNEQLDIVSLGGNDKIFVQMPEPAHGILANIVRVNTGAGDDSLKVTGSTLNDVIRASAYTGDANYRFQMLDTECLQVFGFIGNDTIENSSPVSSLLDGGAGNDIISGSNSPSAYDVIFGGDGIDQLLGRAGNDFLYADHDYNFGTPVQTFADGDFVNAGLGQDVIIALGGDILQRDPGDFEPDVVVGRGLTLTINDFLFAQLLPPDVNNISSNLQKGLAKKCAMPIV